MATKLKNIQLTSVDLVRAGANQEADICIHKSFGDAPNVETPPKEEKRTISKSAPDRYDYLVEVFP